LLEIIAPAVEHHDTHVDDHTPMGPDPIHLLVMVIIISA
jgi:hypothetical protein